MRNVARAVDGPVRQVIEFAGRRRVYHRFTPPGTLTTGPAPLIVLLHGSGEGGVSPLRAWVALASQERFAVVAPDAHDRGAWHLRNDGPAFIRTVVAAVQQEHAIDRRRVYLFGHSGGAVYARAWEFLRRTSLSV